MKSGLFKPYFVDNRWKKQKKTRENEIVRGAPSQNGWGVFPGASCDRG